MENDGDDSPTPFTPVDGASGRVKLMPWVLAHQERIAPEKPTPGVKHQRKRHAINPSAEARPS